MHPQHEFKSKSCPTQRAPDWWESPRFQAVCVARSWFRQSGVISSHPPAGNAYRWAASFSEVGLSSCAKPLGLEMNNT